MSRAIWTLVAIVTAILLAAPAVGAEPAESRVVTGRVKNGTANSESVGDLDVRFNTVSNSDVASASTTKAGQDGAFRLADVPHAAGQMHTLTTKFRGVEYTSQPFNLDDASPKDIELLVYEVTDRDKDLRIERSHSIVDIDPDNRMILVTDYMMFNNSGDRTYVGEGRSKDGGWAPTLRFPLPEGAGGASGKFAGRELDFVHTDGGFATGQPVPPGATEVTVSYMLPFKASDVVVQRTVGYPTTAADVFVGDVGASVTMSTMTAKGPFEAEKQKYQYFVGRDLGRNADVSISLRNLPSRETSPVWLWPGLASVLAGAVVAFTYVRLRSRRPLSTPSSPGTARAEAPVSARGSLLHELAELDDMLEAGLIGAEEHQARRTDKKRELMAIARSGRPITPPERQPAEANDAPARPRRSGGKEA